MNMDLTPGRIVELDDRLYLVEIVEITVSLQQIKPLAPQIEKMVAADWKCETHYEAPVFVQLRGKLGDADNPIDKLVLLYKEEEL